MVSVFVCVQMPIAHGSFAKINQAGNLELFVQLCQVCRQRFFLLYVACC